MSGCQAFPLRITCVLLLVASVVAGAPGSASLASAADKESAKDGGKVAGILIDKKDDWISVKADGDDEPVKYQTGGADDKKLSETLKTLFTVSRVELTYQTDGASRKLISIKRHVPKANGTVTGEVVKNYGWWVEVKPKTGVPDGYACNYPFDKHQDTMDKLKELQPGDSVTISFSTDFERHRIQTLHKNAAANHSGASSPKVAATNHDAAKDSGKVAGILFDKNKDWITVKADGEDEPVKYLVDGADKKLQETSKMVFGACRVQLTYKKKGDARQLVSIKRQILKQTGTVTGDVVKVHNDFWVEVKPKNGTASPT